ncbi:MAG: hypothetical protein M3Q57_05680, partial [Pseudomonadota bacterium]|nr:hypothetical protein [Pseudomonadota bacterium]
DQIRRLALEYVAREQARCVADLAAAIAEAQSLARSMGAGHPGHGEASALHDRLEKARLELETLRRGDDTLWCGELSPEWTNLLRLGPHGSDHHGG